MEVEDKIEKDKTSITFNWQMKRLPKTPMSLFITNMEGKKDYSLINTINQEAYKEYLKHQSLSIFN
ncbi:hypothetical protein KHA80_07220 [Anaerobacillus sp. HL2]|nr:hypothetical protein KHA80_07220 [Anaerobacillus sp. HL2]